MLRPQEDVSVLPDVLSSIITHQDDRPYQDGDEPSQEEVDEWLSYVGVLDLPDFIHATTGPTRSRPAISLTP
jgi:hypothetical protein